MQSYRKMLGYKTMLSASFLNEEETLAAEYFGGGMPASQVDRKLALDPLATRRLMVRAWKADNERRAEEKRERLAERQEDVGQG